MPNTKKKPAGKIPAGKKPAGKRPSGGKTAGKKPAGKVPVTEILTYVQKRSAYGVYVQVRLAFVCRTQAYVVLRSRRVKVFSMLKIFDVRRAKVATLRVRRAYVIDKLR